MNNPVKTLRFTELVENLKRFEGNVIIQSMFLRGYYKNQVVDNTTDEEIGKWLGHLAVIRPKMVMIYPIARAAPVHNLEIIPIFELERIAEKVKRIGLEVKVY